MDPDSEHWFQLVLVGRPDGRGGRCRRERRKSGRLHLVRVGGRPWLTHEEATTAAATTAATATTAASATAAGGWGSFGHEMQVSCKVIKGH